MSYELGRKLIQTDLYTPALKIYQVKKKKLTYDDDDKSLRKFKLYFVNFILLCPTNEGVCELPSK